MKKLKRIKVTALVSDGTTEAVEEVFIPVSKLENPDKHAFTTQYGKETIKVKAYQTDLLSELFKIRGISSRKTK